MGALGAIRLDGKADGWTLIGWEGSMKGSGRCWAYIYIYRGFFASEEGGCS